MQTSTSNESANEKNDIYLKIAKEEKDAIVIDFEIKMYIVVVVCDATFDDEIVDENDEIETKAKEAESKRASKISLIKISNKCSKNLICNSNRTRMFAKIML